MYLQGRCIVSKDPLREKPETTQLNQNTVNSWRGVRGVREEIVQTVYPGILRII
jgi:hypothetical protein